MQAPDLTSFSEYLTRIRARSPRTAASYVLDVRAFAMHCLDNGGEWPDCISRTSVGLYLVERTSGRKGSGQGKLSQRSAARVVSSITAYCDYLVANSELAANPLEGFTPPKYSRKLPAYLSAHEIKELVQAYDKDPGPLGLRNSAILYLLYSAGIRVSECELLDVGSVQPDAQIITVFGKGGKQRAVPYGGQAASRLQLYLASGRPVLLSPASGDALFVSRTGRRLGARSIQLMLDKAALLAGMVKPVSPHKLRHAYATHMLEGGADIRVLQELLGHESLGTTQQYTKVTRTQLRDVYLKSHPRATKSDEK